ncbi:MAG: sensor histidine kinase [Oscillospiraceae bacterium]
MLLSYLRRHCKIIIMLAIFSAIFAAVFSLYDLPTEAVLYSVALCAAVGAGLFAVGYTRYLGKHRALTELRGQIIISTDRLPSASGAIEEDYRELLLILRAELARSEQKADAERRESEDYYTLWAHQIKTPIAAMRLLLQQEETSANSAVASELFRIEQYVEMALSYERLESDTTDYLLRRCALDEIVRGCLRKYARQFILKKVAVDFTESGKTVLSDEKWLAFVIEQLLSNALKYTPSGGVTRIYSEGSALVIADTGIGIREEDLPRLFQRGFTGYNGREDKKSTGIGLYMCRCVCDRLGHGIALTSRQGEGTRVSLDLRSPDMLME